MTGANMVASARRYEFDGQMRTVSEIHALVPIYSLNRLRMALKMGCKSVQDLAVWEAKGAQSRLQGSKRAASTRGSRQMNDMGGRRA